VHEVLAHIVTAVFNIPDWAPRLLRRSAALVLVLVILLAPGSFRAGFATWVQIETTTIMKRMAPLLQPPVGSPNVHNGGATGPVLP